MRFPFFLLTYFPSSFIFYFFLYNHRPFLIFLWFFIIFLTSLTKLPFSLNISKQIFSFCRVGPLNWIGGSVYISISEIFRSHFLGQILVCAYAIELYGQIVISCTIPFVTVPCARLTIGITLTFIFHSFFSSIARYRYLWLFSLSFNFTFWSAETAKSPTRQVLFFIFLLTINRSGRLTKIKWSIFISLCQGCLFVLFSGTDSVLCIYHLFVWSTLNFLHSSQWIPFPTQSCLVKYYFCVNLQHSLIMWLIVSSLSPYNLHLLFCCVLSLLALIWFVLMALFCAAIRRDLVSLLRFSFLSHVQAFMYEIKLFLFFCGDFFVFLFSSYFCSVWLVLMALFCPAIRRYSVSL